MSENKITRLKATVSYKGSTQQATVDITTHSVCDAYFAELLEDEKYIPNPNPINHEVKKGDRIDNLAKKYGVSKSEIVYAESDKAIDPTNLKADEKLVIKKRKLLGKNANFNRLKQASLGQEIYLIIETTDIRGETVKININQGKEEVIEPVDHSLNVLEDGTEKWTFESVIGEFKYKYRDKDKNEIEYLNQDDYKDFAIVKVKLRPKLDTKLDSWVKKIKKNDAKKAYLYLYVEVDADLKVRYHSGGTEGGDKYRFGNQEGKWLAVNTCYCNRDITESELTYIVTELRKKEIITPQKRQYAPNRKDLLFINDEGVKLVRKGNDGYYDLDNNFVQKEKPEEYRVDETRYTLIKLNLFKSKKSEKINSTVTFKSFAEELNKVFNTYEINTCIRKIHFLAQCYHETNRFVDTYEGKNAITDPRGGRHYLARGIMHMTHIDIYQNFYMHLNGRKPTEKELKEFVPTIAKRLELACVSAGFYWKYSGIYKEDKKGKPLIGDLSPIADTDDVIEVSRGINGYVSEKKMNGLEERKKYTKDLKTIMEYANCINK